MTNFYEKYKPDIDKNISDTSDSVNPSVNPMEKNIYGGYLGLDQQSLQDQTGRLHSAIEDTEKYEEMLRNTSGIGYTIKNTITGIPKAFWKTLTNPLETIKGASLGTIKGLTLGYIDPDAKTDVQKAAKTAFDFASIMVPWTGATKIVRGGTALTKLGRRLQTSTKLFPKMVSGATEIGGSGTLIGLLERPGDDKSILDMEERIKSAAIYGGAGVLFGGISPAIKPLFKGTIGKFKNFTNERNQIVKVANAKGIPAVYEPIPVKPRPVTPEEFPTRFKPLAEMAQKSRTFTDFETKFYKEFPVTNQLSLFDTSKGINLRDIFNTTKGITSNVNTKNFIPATNKSIRKIYGIKNEMNISDNQFKMLKKQFLTDGTLHNIDIREARNFSTMLKGIVKDGAGKVSFSKSTTLVTKELAEKEVRKIGILNYFLAPRKAFQRLNLEKETEPIFNSFNKAVMYVADKSSDIAGWKKELGNTFGSRLLNRGYTKEQSRRMFQAINNQEKNIPLSNSERLVVTRAKMLMKELADMTDEANKILKIDPMKRKENYITNLITDNARIIVNETKGNIPTSLLSAIDRRIPTKTINKLLFERKGNLPIKEDFWGAIDTALKMHSQYSFISPAVNRTQKLLGFLQDRVDKRTWDYIVGNMKAFVGRPSKTEVFLRDVDDMIGKFITKVPLLRKKVSVEFADGASEIFQVPLITSRTPVAGALFPSKIFRTMKTLKYWRDLSFSIPYYALNMTQFWQNVPAKLRGTPVDIYLSAGEGYFRMLQDFFRPSKWQYWRKKGVLSEMDNFIDREISGNRGFIGDVMNMFSTGSEFNNRVATVYAVDANLKRLAKKGDLEKLWPELNKAFGKEAESIAKNISDITQFRFGIETKPAVFRNPIMDLYHQYNTFALSQGELVWGMANKLQAKGLLSDLTKAIKNKETTEFLSNLATGERGEIIRYVTNASALIMILNSLGGSFFKAIGRSVEPTFLQGTVDFGKGIATGDPQLMQDGLLSVIIPISLQGAIQYGKPDQFEPAKNLFKTIEIAGQLLDGEEQITIYTRDKLRVNRVLDRNQAVREILFGTGRVPEFEQRSEVYKAIREINKEAELKREDEWLLAREIVDSHIRGNDRDQITEKMVSLYENGLLTEKVFDKVETLLEEEVLGITAVDRSIKNISGNDNKAIFLMKMKETMTIDEFEELMISLYQKGSISDDVLENFAELLTEEIVQ